MNKIIKLLPIVLICLFGSVSVLAKQSTPNKCKITDVSYVGSYSFKVATPEPGQVTVSIQEIEVQIQHKDGTYEKFSVGSLKDVPVEAKDVADADAKVKDAVKAAATPMMQQKCKAHGCNKN